MHYHISISVNGEKKLLGQVVEKEWVLGAIYYSDSYLFFIYS
jgi:hypothetical protein